MLLGRPWLNEVNAVGVYSADGFLIFGEGGVMKQVPRFVSIHELSTEELQNIVSKDKAGDAVFITNGRAKDDVTTKSVLSTLLELMADAQEIDEDRDSEDSDVDSGSRSDHEVEEVVSPSISQRKNW
jgi:hypothetical protein